MKFLAALAALVASAQAGIIGYAGLPAGHIGYAGVPAGPAIVPGPQVVGALATGPNVLPSRAAVPAPYTIEEAPIVNTHVEPVEQWALSINF